MIILYCAYLSIVVTKLTSLASHSQTVIIIEHRIMSIKITHR